MTLTCIWWWGSSSEDLGSVKYSFLDIISGPLLPGMAVSVKIPSIGLFINYLNKIESKKKTLLKNNYTKNWKHNRTMNGIL